MEINQERIDIESTHILLKTDIIEHDIKPIIKKQRQIIKDEIRNNPHFIGFDPIEEINSEEILEIMTRAAIISDTGPMSSVAGAISQICLNYLEKYDTKYTIIENGGDIALKTNKKVVLGVYAGKSKLTGKIGFKLKPKPYNYGVCTSSGTVGHSKSFGKTDAAIVFAKNSSIADSLATSIGNYGNGNSNEDIVHNALAHAEEYKEYYDGVIVISEEVLGKIGHIPKLTKTNKKSVLSELFEIE